MSRSERRREEIVFILSSTSNPISGGTLSELLKISRQIIVQDISALRASGIDVLSTNTGYLLLESPLVKRVIKASHTDEDIAEELGIIIGLGAYVEDVFIKHRAYGKIVVPLNIKTKKDIDNLIQSITSGVSRPLKNLTKSYHYHTISAKSEAVLDKIEKKLNERGFLLIENSLEQKE